MQLQCKQASQGEVPFHHGCPQKAMADDALDTIHDPL